MKYTFTFDTDNYDDEESLVGMIEAIIHLLEAANPNMIDLAMDFKKQLVNQKEKCARSKTKDKAAIMHLFDECVRKHTMYNSLHELCEGIDELGQKAYDNIWSSIGDALGPFAYTIHEFHVDSWMYELIDIYEKNWDWS